MFKRKKILAFSMLLIVAVPLIFFIGFVVKERMIKNEMKNNLETSSLKTIIVNEADIQWADENKEVFINGNLFDVKSYTIADGKITLTGLFDTDEVKLHSQLQNFMQQKDDSNTPLNQMAFKFLFSPLYINSTAATCQSTIQIVSQQYLPFIENSLPGNYLSKSGPPPKFS
jgi:hypothetical protein